MVTFAVFLLILGALIIVHEFGHFITAKRLGVKVEQFCLGFGRTILKRKKGDTEYSIKLVPLGGFVKLAGDSLEEYKGSAEEYLGRPAGQRAAIVLCGPLLNYLLGFLCFSFIFFSGYPTLTTKVGGLIDGFGAKDAGLSIGDKILAVDGKQVAYWEDLQLAIQGKTANSKVTLGLLRNEERLNLEVKLKTKQLDDSLGQKRNMSLLGVVPADEIAQVRYGFFKSIHQGAKKTWGLTLLTYKALWRMLRGKMSIRDSVTGPLGIFYITDKATKVGFIAVLHLVAVLSISLAIFNILPFPVLDGGHIFLLGIEKIRGRYISQKTERIITQAGFSVIITLAVLVTCNDFVRLFGDKIAQRLVK